MLLSFLSVICVGTVLAHVVLLNQQRIHRQVRINREGNECHLGALFHNFGVIYCVVWRSSPRERSVILHQNSWGVIGIDLANVQDLIDDDITRFQLVVPLHLSLSHNAGAGDVLIEVVGVSGTDVGNITTCLSKCCSIGRVGVNHALDVGEGLI